MKRKALEIKVGDFVNIQKHWFISRHQKSMPKCAPIFVGAFRLFEVVNNNLIIDIEGEKTAVTLDQIREYKFKNDNEHSRMSSGQSQCSWILLILLFSQCLPDDNFVLQKCFVPVMRLNLHL